ncbi:MAG: response regulator [Chloroflexi bacterium]|nr:response regulator [Chloroflexota bacterium]
MSGPIKKEKEKDKEIIKVLIVDDIPETRENLRKLLAFEQDIQVVGGDGAKTGREAVELAQKFKPDVVLMDINMPDMDGISATKAIASATPTAAVVMMSVQGEAGYLRQAMLAGARDFLTKPISSEDLYTTIRRVYEREAPTRKQYQQMAALTNPSSSAPSAQAGVPTSTVGAGHIIVVYSPQAGAGVTTLATNIASSLMRPDTRVLLVDCNLQFGDVDAVLNLQAQSNISDLTRRVHDLDQGTVDSVLVTHTSGLKVLVAPPRPEQAYDIAPDSVKDLLVVLADSYDFVVVDTPTQYDNMTLNLFEVAEKIVLVATPTIPAIRNIRKMLDIFDSLEQPKDLVDKVLFVLNRVINEKERGRGAIPTASISSHLKRDVVATIPLDERVMMTAVNQGFLVVTKFKSQSPGRELVDLAEQIRRSVGSTYETDSSLPKDSDPRSKSGIRSLFGGSN